jgi:L-threonylcarbamoyladenylate synthase
MKTEILPVTEFRTALRVLDQGGLVAFPTDTVYGLGALAFHNQAIESLYIAKDRPAEKGIPILIGDFEAIELVVETVPVIARKFASRFWPGPLTCILPKKSTLPEAVSNTPTVAVRLPDHNDTRALLRAAGPLAVTSANISGAENPLSAQEVYRQLNGRIPLILDGGKAPGGIPSTLVDCTGIRPIILREGPILLADLLACLD